MLGRPNRSLVMKNCFGRNEQIIRKSIYSSRIQSELSSIFWRIFGYFWDPIFHDKARCLRSERHSFPRIDFDTKNHHLGTCFIKTRGPFPDSILARFGLHFGSIFETFFDTFSMLIFGCIFYLIFNDFGLHFGSVLDHFFNIFG